MRQSLFPALIAVGLLTAPVLAGEPASTSEAPKITDKNDPNYVKCRTESIIGSHARKRRVCLTNREWAEVARDGNATANRIVENARSGHTLSN